MKEKITRKFIEKFIISNKVMVLVVALAAVSSYAILSTISFRVSEESNNYDALMTKLVENYFDENLKGKVIGINRQEISLSAIEKTGVDIGTLSNCDRERTKSFVVIENPTETDPAQIKYTTENHLFCGNFSNGN